MRTFRFRFPRWHKGLMVVLAGVVAWAAYRTGSRPTLHWIDAIFAVLTQGLPMLGLWREVRQLGGSLTVSPSGIEYRHPDHPAQNWQVPAVDVERIATFETAFEPRIIVIRKSGPPLQLSPANWEDPRDPAGPRREHPLLRALGQYFPVRGMDPGEAAKVLAPTMELGRMAARLTLASVIMALVTIAVLFSIPLDMLDDGIPWTAILFVFAAAAGGAVWLTLRDRTAQLRVPMVPLMFGMAAAVLFTVSSQKMVYLAGKPEQVRFRLEKISEGFQIWRDMDGESVLEFPAAEGKYREAGTVVALEIRTGPFGLRAIGHSEIEARLSR